MSATPNEDDGHRWDDPAGQFLTLYCATDAEGALGECLGEFAFNARAASRIETFLEGDAEAGSNDEYQCPLTGEDIEAFGWNLAHARGYPEAVLIDVDSYRTYLAVAPRAIPALAALGIQRFDRATVLDKRRYVTRTLAGIYHEEAFDADSGRQRANGLRFTSRLPPAWECWALWQPLPVDRSDVSAKRVTIDLGPLRTAAAMLGVQLA